MRAVAVVWHTLMHVPLPLLAASGVGWALLAVGETVAPLPSLCIAMTGSARDAGAAGALDLLLAWLPMLLAMMSPVLAPALLHLWQRSLRRRRIRAAALFLIGYVGVWLMAGAGLMLLLRGLDGLAAAGTLPVGLIAVLAAALWQLTSLKRISLDRCHRRPPLAAFGLRAEWDAWRYGASQGASCVGACWAMMLVMMALPSPLHWVGMPIATFIALWERVPQNRPKAPRATVRAAA